MKLKWIMVPLLAASFLLAQSGNDLLQQGLRKERSEGNYKAAIEIYKRILKQYAPDRKLAATALLRIAHCQEREGNKEARSSYERLIKEYGEQTQAVSEAQARITALKVAPSSAPRVRQLWAGDDVDDSGSLSPDGRWLTYANWETGDLGMRDLVNGTNKLLTNTGGWVKSGGDFAEESRFSPDGKRIVYSWFTPRTSYSLKIMNADGTGDRSLGWSKVGWVAPLCWSPDGAHILAFFRDSGQSASLHLVNAASGESREIVPPGRQYFGASFSPDGKWIALTGPIAENPIGPTDLYIMPAAGGTPDKLDANPSNDMLLSWSQDGTSLLFMSDRGGSWGLWRLPVHNGKADGSANLIRGELGNRLGAIGLSRSGSLIYRLNFGGTNVYTADFDPFTGKRGSEPTLLSQLYPGNSSDPQPSPDGRRLAYNAGTNVGSVVVRDQATGKEQVHTARANHLVWSSDSKRILLEQAGKGPNSRDLAWLDPDSGAVTPFRTIEPTRNGLNPRFSPDGRTLYMTLRPWPGESWQVIAMDVATGQQRELYRTDDRFLNGLALSPDGRTLATMRQVSVWNTRGEQDFELVMVPAAGGPARVAATIRAAQAVVAGSFTPDGKRVLVLRDPNPVGSRTVVTDLVTIEVSTGNLQIGGLQLTPRVWLTLDSSGKHLLYSAGKRRMEMWIAENILGAK